MFNSTDLKSNIGYVVIYDAVDCNPNGDPDNDNMPRIDYNTSQGLATDISSKRKVRDRVYQLVDMLNDPEKDTRYNMYLTTDSCDLSLKQKEAVLKVKEQNLKEYPLDSVYNYLVNHYFDIRFFGGAMNGFGKEKRKSLPAELQASALVAFNIYGAVEWTFSRSINEIEGVNHTITRKALANEDEAKKKDSTMGTKKTVPYGLYKAYVSVNYNQAKKNGFNSKDLKYLEASMKTLFEQWTASKAGLCVRKIFKIEEAVSKYNTIENSCYFYQMRKLLEEVCDIKQIPGVEYATSIKDFDIAFHKDYIESNYEGCTATEIPC